MTKDTIFLLEGKNAIKEVTQEPYENEALLQQLIADHPELLAGQQLDPENPPRWMLVCREAGIADSKETGDRWSVDHLLLDQHGTPTFVEVKRSTDTRIRREVVGQMLEYAANALAHWPPDRIRQFAEKQAGGVDELGEQIWDLVGEDDDLEKEDCVATFWKSVEENLGEGRVRLLFVADKIPSELRLIIEFLNDKMRDVQVMGLELVQYHKGDLRVLVPRAVGQTEAARRRKAKPSWKKTTLQEFLEKCLPEVRPLFKELLAQARERKLVVYWGKVGFSVRVPDKNGSLRTVLRVFPPGTNNWKHACIRGTLAKLEDQQLADRVRQRLVQEAGFKEAGQYALHMDVLKETIPQARKGLQIIWELAEEMG